MFSKRNSTPGALALILALLGFLAVFWGVEWAFGARRSDLMLENGALAAGQWYRAITAHLVHLSLHHTVLNSLGLVLVAATLSPVLHARALLGVSALGFATISLGWWILQPDAVTYAGFSGTVHGIFAFGALAYLRAGPRWFGWVVLAALSAKIGFEILVGPVPGADAAIAGRVSTLSHGLGTLAGALSGPWHRIAKPWLILLACVAIIAAMAHERHFAPMAPAAVSVDG